MNVSEPDVPAEVVAILAVWYRWFRVCQTLHYAIGIAGTVGAVLLARPPDALKPYSTALALMVAASSATTAFFKSSEKARAYLTAWRILGKATDDFRSGRIDVAALRDEKKSERR